MKFAEINILVLGAENVGKSALTVRFLTRRFIGDYQSNEDSVYKHVVNCDDDHFKVAILDTCSKMQNTRHLTEQIRWADAAVIVYDVSSYRSFDAMQDQLRHINRLRKSHFPTIVLANKVDLHPEAHEVDSYNGRTLAEEYRCPFFEVSASDGWMDVTNAFGTAVRLGEAKRKKPRSPLLDMRKRRGNVTKHMASKVLQVVSWSPKRS